MDSGLYIHTFLLVKLPSQFTVLTERPIRLAIFLYGVHNIFFSIPGEISTDASRIQRSIRSCDDIIETSTTIVWILPTKNDLAGFIESKLKIGLTWV